MKKDLTVALSAVMLLAGAALAGPPPVGLAGSATITVQNNLSQHTVTDLTSAFGGARSHGCRVNSVAGAMLTSAGLALGSHWLTAIGNHLTVLSVIVCV